MSPSTPYDKNKRIASNTLVLFVRMFILTIINLYAVRLVLKGLGEEDYGIFTTIGGVVTATNIFSGILALSIQRFYSFYMGRNDLESQKDIFSISINIAFILSALTILILETIGLWFVNTRLIFSTEHATAIQWVYQFSVFILICSILQIPYTAAIFSHEDMNVYAMISTAECLLKLASAWLIAFVYSNNLPFYTACLFATALIILVSYVLIGHNRYEECHYRKPRTKHLYKNILSFSGWTLFSSIASTGMIQGNIILTNIFFGPVITAAFGIAQQINNAFNALCNSLVLAFRPPMIKAYAEGNSTYLSKLYKIGTKTIFYILIAVSIPIMVEMDLIIAQWLGETSKEVVLFSRLIIIYIVLLAMHSPITIMMQASGHIKEYHLPVESITLLCLPLTWILYKLGFPAYSVFYSLIGVCAVAHIIRLICLHHFFKDISIGDYILSFGLPALTTTVICMIPSVFVHRIIGYGAIRTLSVFLLSPLIVFIFGYLIGMNTQEKQYLKNKMIPSLKNKLCHK